MALSTKLPKVSDNNPYRISTKMMDTVSRRAKRCGYEFDLDREWFLEKLLIGRCEQTGIEFSREREGKSIPKHNPSVDRIDSNRGYTKDNCQMVIYQYNIAKSTWSDESVLEMARMLVERNG